MLLCYILSTSERFVSDINFNFKIFAHTKLDFLVLHYLQNSSFQAMLPVVRERIIAGFTPKALDLFNREFDFFDKVTSISGVLFPLPKEERRAGIRR